MENRKFSPSANKKRGRLKKYIANYDTLRPFLRFISYGCYTKADYPKSSHTYENNLARLRQFLPAERLPDAPRSSGIGVRLKGDAFLDSDNFLINTFCIKSMTKHDLFYKFHLLRILNASHTPLTPTELLKKLEITDTVLTCPPKACTKPPIVLDFNTMRRHLDDLAKIGLVVSQPHGKRVSYRLAPNPLEALSPRESEELLFAVAFHKNNSLLSVPGYHLETTLREMHGLSPIAPSPYQFKNLDFTRVIDDEVVYHLLCAIEQQRLVTFSYAPDRPAAKKDYTVTAFPESIITDYLTGNRQYLIAYVSTRKKARPPFSLRQTFQLEKMFKLKLGRCIPRNALRKTASKGIPLLFRVNFPSVEERTRLLFRIKERFPDPVFTPEGPHSLICMIRCLDHLQHVPWFRTLYPDIEVLHTPRTYLREYLKDTLKETLQNYGIST